MHDRFRVPAWVALWKGRTVRESGVHIALAARSSSSFLRQHCLAFRCCRYCYPIVFRLYRLLHIIRTARASHHNNIAHFIHSTRTSRTARTRAQVNDHVPHPKHLRPLLLQDPPLNRQRARPEPTSRPHTSEPILLPIHEHADTASHRRSPTDVLTTQRSAATEEGFKLCRRAHKSIRAARGG